MRTFDEGIGLINPTSPNINRAMRTTHVTKIASHSQGGE
jgi:hypothetical protein